MSNSISIPRKLPLLQVADNILLPGSSMRIPVRNLKNMNMVKTHLLGRNTLSSTIIGVIPREPLEDSQTDELSTLHAIGTAAVVVQVTGTNWPKPSYTLLVTGLCRFKLEQLLQETPYAIATVTQLDKLTDADDELNQNSELGLLAVNFRDQAAKLVDMLDISIPVVSKLKRMLESVPSQHLPDICAALVKASNTEKIQVLDAVDLTDRFKKALPLLMRQIEGLKLLQKAKKDKAIEIRISGKEGGRPYNMRRIFRGKMKTDVDDEENEENDELMDLETKIKNAEMPEHAHKAAMKELKRLKKMPQHMPEQAMIRNYLELMVELPWSKSSTDSLDLNQARRDLDTDHFGLEKLKKRVLEYLAVRQLKKSLKGPILCFVGPPGVGKTSLGKSIAHTLGREFHRISLGGACDQSDIRGHRRTYIGSMPGRIIQGLKTVGTNNPVFLLDEVDKLGKSLHGDPASALLEVLDPEQNNSFTDHYMNVPFDLSQVMFIATANNMATIPPPLLDRMEIIQVPGYTQEEKVSIAMRHLKPKQLQEHGLTLEQLQIPDDSLKTIISKYTREAGVRTLERKLAAICRTVAVRVLENSSTAKREKQKTLQPEKGGVSASSEHLTDVLSSHDATALAHPPEMPIVIDDTALEDILGQPIYEREIPERLVHPGVAIGLAWTPMGGEIMFVEASCTAGEGGLTLTGQLGDVMKESASLAQNWVKTHAKQLNLDGTELSKKDIHVHFPAGAVGKDGPSAGVTIATVLVSMFIQKCVRSDTAMTGEITLRGVVLPVGGIKEKVLAAHRAGLRRIILPRRNEKDLQEIPNNVKADLVFILVNDIEDVLRAAFYDLQVPVDPFVTSKL
ncbi:lon protease homolog 2, peroxisomal-like [Mya arenaria]|uniref:lon protease homolog 2, peroxisomal-like n=1 Tax=Mya arenaria TaxID=6604 RepID=UPI0022E130F4|nr:lon protease homolog 2, peroxisomal-like [Mya arenaria]